MSPNNHSNQHFSFETNISRLTNAAKRDARLPNQAPPRNKSFPAIFPPRPNAKDAVGRPNTSSRLLGNACQRKEAMRKASKATRRKASGVHQRAGKTKYTLFVFDFVRLKFGGFVFRAFEPQTHTAAAVYWNFRWKVNCEFFFF